VVQVGLVLHGCLVLVQSELLSQVLRVLLVLMMVLRVLLILVKVRLYWVFFHGYAVQLTVESVRLVQ
jgi:hypothetical protein